MNISNFMKQNFKHFNARVCVEAAEAWIAHIKKGGKMFITLAGAMSTAELGISLSKLIEKDLIHGISCTGANLEEDIFNLVAHNDYKTIPEYRYLSKEQEEKLYNEGYNRVTDTCIPEEEAFRKIEKKLLKYWKKAEENKQSFFPYEYLYQIFEGKDLEDEFQIDKKNSWLYSAYKKNIPIFVPGFEDSTTGNFFVSNVMQKNISSHSIVKSGTALMEKLINWYLENSRNSSIGFFQIGGGIAGDFPICVVPLIRQDMQNKCNLWGYFCQISDSITSFGSYSGATPNEKITWGKISKNTPSFVIESDATIVAPLIFQYILENI